MNKFNTLKTIVALGLLAFGVTTVALAQERQIASFALALNIQGPTTSSGPVDTYTVTKVKLTTKDILNLIASNYGTTFPSGAELVMNDYGGSFSVYTGNPNTDGTNLLNVSTSLFNGEYKTYVYNEKYNNATGSETYNSTYNTYLYFNDSSFNNNGNFFDYVGTTTYSYSYNGSTGKFKESIKAAGPIEGTFYGYPFTGTGAITTKGSN